MTEICNDNRFELIEKYKNELLESTNIADSKEEMNVIDSILFRFWQMGWLDGLEHVNRLLNDCNTYKIRWAKARRTARAEAIKEFLGRANAEECNGLVWVGDLDEIAKKMIGEQK